MIQPRSGFLGFIVLGSAVVLAASVFAEGTNLRYEAAPGSKVRIDGTSTIHDWTVEGRIIGGHVDFDPSFKTDPTLKKTTVTPDLDVKILVRTLKSGKKSMDAVMWDALKQTEFPDIKYKLLRMVAKGDAAPGGPVEFDTQGTLTVAGVTRTNSMVVTMVPMEGDKLKFSGNTAVKMTDFGIKPPAPEIALGLIKTGDEVKIGFEWLTALKTGAAQ